MAVESYHHSIEGERETNCPSLNKQQEKFMFHHYQSNLHIVNRWSTRTS